MPLMIGEHVENSALLEKQVLDKAIREVEAVLEQMRAEHDPLAVHIFVSRRHYRNTRVLKSGKPQPATLASAATSVNGSG